MAGAGYCGGDHNLGSGGATPGDGVTQRRDDEEQRRKLEAAGYVLKEVGGGKRIWEGPNGALYPQSALYKLLTQKEKERREGQEGEA
jgi:hypothetical protein